MQAVLYPRKREFFGNKKEFKLPQDYLEEVYPNVAKKMKDLELFAVKSKKSIIIIHRCLPEETDYTLEEYRKKIGEFVKEFCGGLLSKGTNKVIYDEVWEGFLSELQEAIQQKRPVRNSFIDEFVIHQRPHYP